MRDGSLCSYPRLRHCSENRPLCCKELGLSMSTAFTIFAKKMRRERRITFEVSI